MAFCFVSIVNEAKIKFEEINPLLLGAMVSVHVPVPGLASHLLQGVETWRHDHSYYYLVTSDNDWVWEDGQ